MPKASDRVSDWWMLGRAVDAVYLSHKAWQAKDDPQANPVEQWVDDRLGDVADDVFKLIYEAARVPYPTEAGTGDGGPSPPAEEG